VERLLRPRVALAGLALALVAGGLTGVLSGVDDARQRAQDRYLAAVAPSPIR
jgi:ABC-type nitrate/sulfonate/bicarbonate transport system permease component